MATCTSGSTFAGLLTVTDATGFAVGDRIAIVDEAGLGTWTWVAKITNISGLDFTLDPVPDPDTLPNLQVCFLSNAASGWIGPGGDCSCCDCTCGEARDTFADTQIAYSGGPGSATLNSTDDILLACYGATPTGTTYSFPGLANYITSVDASSCIFSAGDIATGTGTWEGTTDFACGLSGALTFDLLTGSTPVGTLTVGGTATVAYSCVGGTPRRVVACLAGYCIRQNHGEIQVDTFTGAIYLPGMVSWTLLPFPYSSTGRNVYQATVGNVTYQYTLQNLYKFGGLQIWSLQLAGWSEIDTTIDLSVAPSCYDPMGFLIGVATLT